MATRPLKHSLQQYEQSEFIQKQRKAKYASWSLDVGASISGQPLQCTIGVAQFAGQLTDMIHLACATADDQEVKISFSLQAFNTLLSNFQLPPLHLDDPQDIMAVSIDIVKSLVLEPLCNTQLGLKDISIDREYELAESELSIRDYVVDIRSAQLSQAVRVFFRGIDILKQHGANIAKPSLLLNVPCQEYHILAGAHLPVEKANQLKEGDVFGIFVLPEAQLMLPGNPLQSEVIPMDGENTPVDLYELKVMKMGKTKTLNSLIFNYNNSNDQTNEMAYIFLHDRVILGSAFNYQGQDYFLVKAVKQA